MVHVRKCPCKRGRSKPTTEFYNHGKPQIYCMGWVDLYNDEPLDDCKNCADWTYGEQAEKDFEIHLKEVKNGKRNLGY